MRQFLSSGGAALCGAGSGVLRPPAARCAVFLCALLLAGLTASPVEARVTARLDGTLVRIEVDGKPFTAYKFDASQKYPYFWPVNGPAGGQSLTTETSQPWPHHHSLFFGCDKVNGFNFWQDANARGQIVSSGPRIVTNGPDRVELADRCLWTVPGRDPIIEDTRRILITAPSKDLRLIDFHVTLRALVDVRIDRTNHSLFSMRVMPHIAPDAGGTLVSAEGRTGEKHTFGQKSPWCDFSGDNHGRVEGIAMFDHPDNPWFPTPWFTRNYGFASPTPMFWLGDEGFRLPKGETLSLRYRVVVHAGDAKQARLDTLYRQWADTRDASGAPATRASTSRGAPR